MTIGGDLKPPLDRPVELVAVLALLVVGASLAAALVSDARSGAEQPPRDCLHGWTCNPCKSSIMARDWSHDRADHRA